MPHGKDPSGVPGFEDWKRITIQNLHPLTKSDSRKFTLFDILTRIAFISYVPAFGGRIYTIVESFDHKGLTYSAGYEVVTGMVVLVVLYLAAFHKPSQPCES